MKKELLEKIERLDELWKYQEIIDLIEALPTEQLDTELIGELGKAYNNIENYEKGLKILKSIENEKGDNALWNWRVGYSYFFLKDYIKAEKYFLKAYELEPDDEYARDFACDFLIGTYTALSKLESRNGNSEKAIEYAFESRKYAYDEKGIMKADSFLAWLYNKYKEYTKAEEILRNQLVRNKDDKWTLSELGYSLSGQEKYEEAIEKFEYVLSLEVEDEGDLEFIYSQLGWCHRHLWNFEKALEYYIKSKEEGRNDVWINTEIAICYETLEKHEKALEYALIAYELDRDDIHVLSELGVIYKYMKKHEEALEYFERAMELGRNDAWIFKMKGMSLLELKRYEEALDSFKNAYDLNSDSWYLYSMGRCLRGLESYEEAIKVLLESRQISLAKEDVVDREDFELAYCYIGIGDKENAQKYLDSARDSVTQRGVLNDYIKEKIEEIEKGILSLDKFLN